MESTPQEKPDEEKPEVPEQIPQTKYDQKKEEEKKEEMKKVEEKFESKGEEHKSVKLDQGKVFEVIKALTAMKLSKEDSVPGEVLPGLYLGSIGCAYNKKALEQLGITHILTCAANIKPRFKDVSSFRLFTLVGFHLRATELLGFAQSERGSVLRQSK